MINCPENAHDLEYQRKFKQYQDMFTEYVFGSKRPRITQHDRGRNQLIDIWSMSHRAWEYPYLLTIVEPKPTDLVLDVGGTNSIFTWFIASHFGCEIHCVDPEPVCNQDAQDNIKKMGLKYKAFCTNLQDFNPPVLYDIVYSVSTFEHVLGYKMYERLRKEGVAPVDGRETVRPFWEKATPTEEEWEYERKFMEKLSDCVKPGGVLAMTVDFYPGYNTGPGLRSKDDILERIVAPSKMVLIDNDVSYDASVACGSIFLIKPPKTNTTEKIKL